jgi:hypothetical protein
MDIDSKAERPEVLIPLRVLRDVNEKLELRD